METIHYTLKKRGMNGRKKEILPDRQGTVRINKYPENGQLCRIEGGEYANLSLIQSASRFTKC